MPPTLLHSLRLEPRRDTILLSTLRQQWSGPTDILSVLLLVGPDIVQKAVAQLAGRSITPVAFSFGWVAYSTSALMAALGDGKLMPNSDVDGVLVVDIDTGHSRVTKNWVLGRLLRDMDDNYDHEIPNEKPHVPPATDAETLTLCNKIISSAPPHPEIAARSKPWEALRITVFEVDDKPPVPHGVPTLDRVWYLGCTVIAMQFFIAIIPWFLHGQWGAFLVTGAGSLFAIASGSLPQWRSEKWACPKEGGASVVLTQGNGSRHAVLILGKRDKKIGLDLEILARGTRVSQASRITTMATSSLAFLWIMLLITVVGLDGNSWYLMGIGLLGSIQNLFAAAAPRTPAALGVHLRYVDSIHGNRVPAVLKEAELKYPGVGISLLKIFFPGGLRAKDEDLDFWRHAIDSKLTPNERGTIIDPFHPLPIINEKESS